MWYWHLLPTRCPHSPPIAQAGAEEVPSDAKASVWEWQGTFLQLSGKLDEAMEAYRRCGEGMEAEGEDYPADVLIKMAWVCMDKEDMDAVSGCCCFVPFVLFVFSQLVVADITAQWFVILGSTAGIFIHSLFHACRVFSSPTHAVLLATSGGVGRNEWPSVIGPVRTIFRPLEDAWSMFQPLRHAKHKGTPPPAVLHRLSCVLGMHRRRTCSREPVRPTQNMAAPSLTGQG